MRDSSFLSILHVMTEPFRDDDLVYADPDRRVIVGRVEFAKNGNAKPLQVPDLPEVPDAKTPKRAGKPPRKRYYPWGTYKTMRKLYRIDGGVEEQERNIPLEDAIMRSMKEPFWD